MAEIFKQINTQILLRSDSSANWSTVNPKLGQGEIAISTDLNQFKIGDGFKTWSELSYFEGNLKDTVAQLVLDVDAVEAILNDNGEVKGLVSRVGEVEGKINNLVAAGGEPNVIVGIKLDGVAVDPDDDRVVNLDVAATYVKKSDFEAYKTEITNKFAEYKTADELTTILTGYVTTGKFDEEIAKLATTTFVNDELAKKVNVSDFNTYKGEVTTELGKKADKTEVENTFANYETKAQAEAKYVQLETYATDKAALEASITDITKEGGAIETAVSAAQNALQANIDKKVDQTAYDTKINAIEEEIEAITSAGLTREVVETLPSADDAQENVIYLVPAEKSDDTYDEYLYVKATGFELIGNTAVSFAGYATEDFVNGKVEAIYKVDGETESGVLVDKISAEATARANAVKAVQDELDALKGENGYKAEIAAEAKAREDADKALGERIDGVVEAAKAYATKTELEAEAKARGDKDTELENAITEVTKENGTIDTRIATAKTALEGQIAEKADKTAFEGHVEAYEAHVEAYEAHIEAYEAHLTAQAEKDEAQDNALAAEATARKAIYDVVEGTESGVLVTKLAAEAEARGELEERVQALEEKDEADADVYATKDELKAAKEALEAADTTLTNGVSANATAIENISKDGGLIDQKVDAAKYITDVDADVFKVESNKLSLNPTTVFILNGGGASGWSQEEAE